MKKTTVLLSGIFLSAIIFIIAVFAPRIIEINSDFIPKTFFTHSIMLTFSLIAIYIFTKNGTFKFKIQKVRFKFYLKGIITAILGIIIANIIAVIILKTLGFNIDPSGNGYTPTAGMNSKQLFIFVFLYASISEELFFRGFIQNYFETFKSKGIRLSKKIFISMPVLLSGVLFGLAHLISMVSGSSGPVAFRTVIFATTLGLIAGYFQEKHNSILPAIVIHMTGNLPILIMSFFI